jgi:hypothetical protein
MVMAYEVCRPRRRGPAHQRHRLPHLRRLERPWRRGTWVVAFAACPPTHAPPRAGDRRVSRPPQPDDARDRKSHDAARWLRHGGDGGHDGGSSSRRRVHRCARRSRQKTRLTALGRPGAALDHRRELHQALSDLPMGPCGTGCDRRLDGCPRPQRSGYRIGPRQHLCRSRRALSPAFLPTTSQAQYSLRFALAARIAKGRVGPDDITGGRPVRSGRGRHDGAHHHLRGHKPPFLAVPGGPLVGRHGCPLEDGRTLSSGDVHARGGPEAHLCPSREIEAKFHLMAQAAARSPPRRHLVHARTPDRHTETRFADLLTLLTDAPHA